MQFTYNPNYSDYLLEIGVILPSITYERILDVYITIQKINDSIASDSEDIF